MNDSTANESVNVNLNLAGTWFVHFGIFNELEGSRILTLSGEFDADTLLDELTKCVVDSLPDDVRVKYGGSLYKSLVIRGFNRIV